MKARFGGFLLQVLSHYVGADFVLTTCADFALIIFFHAK
jgi:hypothetical protein